MASSPFIGQWSPDTAFTGNSQFVVDSNGTIWVVGQSTSGGGAIYNSTNEGISFTEVTTFPNVSSATVAFDPAVTIDASNNLHFIGQVQVEAGVQLVKYEWNTTTSTLSGPFTLSTNGLIGSDYDIVALSNGHCYVVVCLLTGSLETIEGLEIDASGNAVYTDVLVTQAFQVGSRYGSVSLITPDGATVEIYIESHPKLFNFKGMTATISEIVRTAPDAVGASTVLTTFPIMSIDPNLTVIANGAIRYLSMGYYSQAGGYLVGNIIVGALLTSPGTWAFNSYYGSPTSSLTQPVLSFSTEGLVLAYILQNFTTSTRQDAPISLVTLDPTTWLLLPRTDFPYQATATYLRGTRSAFVSNMEWGFIAQRVADGTARFFTGFNAVPTVVISPTTVSAIKGQTYSFDASGSYSPNDDVLVFSWSIDDPTGQAVFTPEGEQATLMLPKSTGPGAETVSITVSVVAEDAAGDVLHTATTATAVLNYATVAPPVITAAGPFSEARNTTVNFTPTVTDAGGNTLTYSWAQTSGTQVTVLSSLTNVALSFLTNGTDVVGEALVFQLTVSDGMNAPVSQSFTFNIAARTVDPDTLIWTRSTWSGSIAERNTTGTWGAGVVVTAGQPTIYSETIPLTTMPWIANSTQNSAYQCTLNDGSPPVIVLLGTLQTGQNTLTVTATGSGTYNPTGPVPGPIGGGGVTNGDPGSTGTYFPSKYMSGSQLQICGLCGAFTDADGNVIQPVSIGPSATLTIPSGATQLQLGVNDDEYEDNTGSFSVTVTLEPRSIYSDFTSAKRANLNGGENVFLLIDVQSIIVCISQDATVTGCYYVFLPVASDSILDAVHSDYNATLVLSGSGLIQQFLPNATLSDTDNVTATITLSEYTTKSYTSMTATPSFNGSRVIALWGSQGVLLLEVATTTLAVLSLLELSVVAGFLYGADNVRFVRLSDVESLRSGEILVGSFDENGNTYETQIDLATRQILSTWDSSTVSVAPVSTGELLYMPTDSYSGELSAPVLTAPTPSGTGFSIAWTQTRSDLVNGYSLFISVDGAAFTLYQTVNSGSALSLVLTNLQPGHVYQFYVQAFSNDGTSPYSNTVQISL